MKLLTRIIRGAGLAVFAAVAGVALPAQSSYAAAPCMQDAVTWTSTVSYAKGDFCVENTAGGKLVYQTDGNLVWYLHGQALWSSGTTDRGADQLVLQADGNVVIYTAAGTPLYAASIGYRDWQPSSADYSKEVRLYNSPGADFINHEIGHAVGISGSMLNGLLWGASSALPDCFVNDTFAWGHIERSFAPGQFCVQNESGLKLVFQGDGNLVVYKHGVARWASNTANKGKLLKMQSDGNVVIYTNTGGAVWSLRQQLPSWQSVSTLNGNGYGDMQIIGDSVFTMSSFQSDPFRMNHWHVTL